MNNATAQLNLSSVNEECNTEEDEEEEEEEFDDTMEREVDSKVDTTYVVQLGDLTDLSFDVNPDSEDEEVEDFSGDDLRVQPGDHFLDQDYDTASEVFSGRFTADYANTFAEPISFKELLWNTAGPSPGGMIIFLGLLKDDLEADEAGKTNQIYQHSRESPSPAGQGSRRGPRETNRDHRQNSRVP